MTGPEAPRVMADIRRWVVFAGAQGATDLWSEGVVAPAAQYKENLYNRAFARGKTIQPRRRREGNAYPLWWLAPPPLPRWEACHWILSRPRAPYESSSLATPLKRGHYGYSALCYMTLRESIERFILPP